MIYVEWVFFACSSIVLLLFGLVSFLILTKMLDFLFVCIIYTFYIKCRYMEENGHSPNNIRASHNIGRLGSLVRVTNFGLCLFFFPILIVFASHYPTQPFYAWCTIITSFRLLSNVYHKISPLVLRKTMTSLS